MTSPIAWSATDEAREAESEVSPAGVHFVDHTRKFQRRKVVEEESSDEQCKGGHPAVANAIPHQRERTGDRRSAIRAPMIERCPRDRLRTSHDERSRHGVGAGEDSTQHRAHCQHELAAARLRTRSEEGEHQPRHGG
jgi:hypothetical protein